MTNEYAEESESYDGDSAMESEPEGDSESYWGVPEKAATSGRAGAIGEGNMPTSSADTASEARYSATFNLGVVEGIMRITGVPANDKQHSCSMAYRWRGRETGEGEIQLGSDQRSYDLTFTEYGTRLEGVFGGCVERTGFTGMKVRAGGNQQGSSAGMWGGFSGASYEAERVGRWH
ncbi:hypothetical protein LTR36_010121 [Oleoguttula mirabilis]|uniref:Uncharacterized protein n=1 Tax=Oleoguttula mirabilis TaxID=1507867 RepID=A0AAV9JRI6_9PEZI|nr:hypothetical protein LTR36_010121 [Oleoguttula mirabilis]